MRVPEALVSQPEAGYCDADRRIYHLIGTGGKLAEAGRLVDSTPWLWRAIDDVRALPCPYAAMAEMAERLAEIVKRSGRLEQAENDARVARVLRSAASILVVSGTPEREPKPEPPDTREAGGTAEAESALRESLQGLAAETRGCGCGGVGNNLQAASRAFRELANVARQEGREEEARELSQNADILAEAASILK